LRVGRVRKRGRWDGWFAGPDDRAAAGSREARRAAATVLGQASLGVDADRIPGGRIDCHADAGAPRAVGSAPAAETVVVLHGHAPRLARLCNARPRARAGG